MKTVYEGFDTISFAVKGALNPKTLEHLKYAKERATKESADQRINIGSREALLLQTGQKGGYRYVLDMGRFEQMISIKDNIERTQWNGFVKIRALGLAVHDWEKSIQSAMHSLQEIGFHVVEISLNRVDYAVDVSTPFPVRLDPERIVTHSRRQIKVHYEPLDVMPLTTVTRARHVQSMTIGKMPSSQICIYDKRAEALSKRNYTWFEIWGLNRSATCDHVLRIEIRAGKTALKDYGITSIEDFTVGIGNLLAKILHVTRYVSGISTDTNISRHVRDPLWLHVEAHVREALAENTSNTCPARVMHVIKDAKADEAKKQVLGNLMNLAICEDIKFENIPDVMTSITEAFNEMQKEGSALHEIYSKKYIRAKDRLRFV